MTTPNRRTTNMWLNRQERLTLMTLGVTAVVAVAVLMWQRQRASAPTAETLGREPVVRGSVTIEPVANSTPPSGDAPGSPSSTASGSLEAINPSTSWDQLLASARQIDVNTASASALQRLPGIGPVLADRIVTSRIQHGRFHEFGDLERVDGIGPKTLQAIEDYVTVR